MAANNMLSGEDGADVPLPPKDPDEMIKIYRREFTLMSWAIGINQATVLTPISYASSVLTNSAGQYSSAVLTASSGVSSLFFATPLFALLGARRGMALGMGLFSVYVFFFAMSAAMCSKFNLFGECLAGESGQLPAALLGAVIGGLGHGVLWTCQGAFFTSVCENLAKMEKREKSEVTTELAASFAAVLLITECFFRTCATLLTSYCGLNFTSAFCIFTGIAIAAATTIICLSESTDLKKTEPLQVGQLFDKALSALRLWSDLRLWALQGTNLAFGFASALMAGYVNRQIISKAFSSSSIGLLGAMTSALAAILSVVLVPAATKFGKASVVVLGAASFAIVALLSLLADSNWGWGAIVFPVLMGIGRAVYESTNKSLFADIFPGEKSPGAFANISIFRDGASTICFFLGAIGADSLEMYLVFAFATLTVPGYVLATDQSKKQ